MRSCQFDQDRRNAFRPALQRPPLLDDAAASKPAHVVAVTPNARGNSRSKATAAPSHPDLRRQPDAGGLPRQLRCSCPPTMPAQTFVVPGPSSRTSCTVRNPLGQRLRIGGLHFRVGVMEDLKGQFLGIDLDDTAFGIPAGRARTVQSRRRG